MNKSFVYAYFATEDFKYTDTNDLTGKVNNFDFKKDDVIYIGISTTTVEERDMTHKMPSVYKGKRGQVINRVLQDNDDKCTIRTIGEVSMVVPFSKKLIHPMEMALVDEFQPVVNIYGR